MADRAMLHIPMTREQADLAGKAVMFILVAAKLGATDLSDQQQRALGEAGDAIAAKLRIAEGQPDRAVVEVKCCPACGFPENPDSGGCGVCDAHPEVLPVCPWCQSPIKGRQFIKRDDDGAWWHERCAWANRAGLERDHA